MLVVDLVGALAALAVMVVSSFLPFLATVAHVLCGTAVGRGIGQESGAAVRPGAVTGSGNISKNNTLRPVRPVRLTPGTSEC